MDIEVTNEKKQRAQDALPTLKEKISYGLGDTACNVVNGLVFSLITLFYTDYVGVSAATVGLVMLISRVFDGFSDVIMGYVVSKTKSKWGQARPWLLWVALPYGIATLAMLTVPQGSSALQFWYILVTYNLCTTVCYTAINVPYGTLSSKMTRSSLGRDLLGVFRMGLSPIGRILSVTFTLPLVKLFGDNQMAWVKAMSIWAFVAVIFLLICFRNCEERVHIEAAAKQNVSVLKNIKSIVVNQYFWLVLILWAVQASYNTVFGTVAPYYCKYILGNDSWLYSTMYLLETLVLIVGVLVSPILLKKFGKRNLALAGSVISIIAQFLLLINPYSISWVFATTVIRAIGTVPLNAFVFGMLCDVIEFGQWKTHVRQESYIVSASSMGAKFGMGLAGAAIGGLLQFSGYISSTTGSAIQPDGALNMISTLFIWGPVILWAIAAAVLLIYKLDKIYPSIMDELKDRESRGEL